MAEPMKNDDKSIRSYILNDVIEKVPIDKSYENPYKVIGNDAIAFYDFQFCSEPEPLQFCNLPVDAVGLIADKLKVEEILMLRRVSKPLRAFIEKQVIDCSKIAVSCDNDLIGVWYGNREILYAKNDEASNLYKESVFMMQKPSIMHGDHYESEAFNDLAWILKNPKLQIERLYFSHEDPCLQRAEYKGAVALKFLKNLELVLKSLKHQISVRYLTLRPKHPDDLLAILPYLKPGYLEKITIHGEGMVDNWKSDENFRKVQRIMQLDQWKQADELHLFEAFHLFPDEVFLQFKKYLIQEYSLHESHFTRTAMMFAASPVFEYCFIWIEDPSNDDNVMDFIGVPGPPTPGYLSVRHYMIPNTDKLLVFKDKYGDIEIEKKTRDVQ